MAKTKQETTTDVLVVEVLDRSGSMSSCLLGAIEGHNDYLKDLKADKTGETFLWLTGFDTVFEDWYQGTPIDEVEYLNMQTFVPRGGTALYDAIAHSITKADEYLKKIGRDESSDNPMKVLHVTLTDGYENSSNEYQGPDGAARLPFQTGGELVPAVIIGRVEHAPNPSLRAAESCADSPPGHARQQQRPGSPVRTHARWLQGQLAPLAAQPEDRRRAPQASFATWEPRFVVQRGGMFLRSAVFGIAEAKLGDGIAGYGRIYDVPPYRSEDDAVSLLFRHQGDGSRCG